VLNAETKILFVKECGGHTGKPCGTGYEVDEWNEDIRGFISHAVIVTYF